ncbi:MAG: hypothetical protein V1874_06345 [Spirochaetota bacterium]
MKKVTLITGVLSLILSTSVFSEVSKIGYKEFYLGQTRNEIKNLVKGKYNNVTFFGNEDMKIETGDLVSSKLFFDHSDRLYFIQVEITSGEIAKVKQRMVEKYGQANDYAGEEFNREINAHLMGRWLEEKRYKISVWQSEYCRTSRFIPCVIFVEYLDLKLKEAKEKHELNLNLETQKKKDSKKYDGF